MTNITTAQVPTTITGGGIGAALGLQAGMAVVNGAIEQGGNAMNERRRYKYDIKRLRETADVQNRQTEFNMSKQKEMWDYTNYENQKKHMEAAGLNPALMYGMSGGGGATATVTQGQGGGGAGSAGSGTNNTKIFDMAEIAQIALLKAQKENIEADTSNKRAEIPVKGAQVPNIQANTKNKQQQHSNLEAEAQNTAQDTQKKVQEVEALRIQNKINEKTANDQIKTIQQEAIGSVIKNALLRQEVTLTGQLTDESRKKVELMNRQINNLAQEIQIKWKQAYTDQQKMDILRDAQLFNEEFGMDDILQNIGIILPTPGKAHKVIEGFRR